MQQRTHGGFTAPALPADKARQGRWGVQVLTVLAVSLALVGLVWLAVEFYGQTIDTATTATEPGALTQPAVTPPPARDPTPADTP